MRFDFDLRLLEPRWGIAMPIHLVVCQVKYP